MYEGEPPDIDNVPVYEIDLNKKYILQLSKYTSDSELAYIKKQIDEWKNSEKTFMLIRGDVKLVKVE